MVSRLYLATALTGLVILALIGAFFWHYRSLPRQPDIWITLTEGMTSRQMSTRVAGAFSNISADDFYALAAPHEGYLFPDTYRFSPNATSSEIVAELMDNFDIKIRPLASDIARSQHSLSDIVIMASILEKEARTGTDKRTVAGILWRRLALGMPLQVDAAPETYDHKGLPPAPIANPGLDAIEAAITPTPTNYLYYLTGKDGRMHYAVTFEQHRANRAKYLD